MASSFITPSQAERYPHFAQFLKNLFEHKICPNNFATKSQNDERREISREYQRTKKSYDAVKLIYDSVWDIIANPRVENDKFFKMLEKTFISSELHQSMRIIKEEKLKDDDNLHVFGIQFKQEPIDDDITLWAQEQLKNELIEKGVLLLGELGQDIQGNNSDLILAKISQLSSLVSSRMETLDNCKKIMEENDVLLKEQYTKYTTILLESLHIMENLLQEHMVDGENRRNIAKSESLEVQCDALYLKIKSLHLEILYETYTEQTVPALKKISKEVETKSEQIENEIRASQLRLNRYKSVGEEFNCLVKEYSKLREAIKQKRWTLDKLKSYSAN
ncbi:HAUS augmin-like complex subunit 4 [Daphnia magna]|uniref:HAUS augmin-like complex subunit 4 n=1 Tax=Daphnia magna TaxID=35525 RepID=UPI001E1BCCAE|nr:HAUS augmin-like complex subunit 4 [Daphnia magna]